MILDMIAQSTRQRVEEQKKKMPLEEIRRLALEKTAGVFLSALQQPPCSIETSAKSLSPSITQKKFETALGKPGMLFICEIKKASPSKGLIVEDFPYLSIARDYEQAGADAISVLTEPDYFLGSTVYLSEIKKHISVPLLRKDFIIDDYQLYESKLIGADAVLLICALLDTETIRDYLQVCDSLELSALVEAHNETEIESALSAGARIIGVNNRDLKTFEVDINNCVKLRPLVPKDVLFVAESGIKTAADIDVLRKAGVDAVLIGETLMRSGDKKAALRELKGK
jgi:indole-3-glycerol phosphate synthase